MALFRIGCFLFTILTIESPRTFLSQRNYFESIDFIFFEGTGESAFRRGAELGMSRALLSEACERDESWWCLPSGLGTATTECVLWKGCVLGVVGAD